MEKLIEELKAGGASGRESEDLAYFSKNLENLYKFERSEKLKEKFLGRTPKKIIYISHRAFAGIMLSAVLLLGFASVVSAQGSIPGDPLYPVKRISEQVITYINPSFKGEILQRRSQEIRELSSRNNQPQMQETISSYEKVLNENRKISPEDISASKNNLEEAQKNASGQNKAEIENAIKNTEKVQSEYQDHLSPFPSQKIQQEKNNTGTNQNQIENRNQIQDQTQTQIQTQNQEINNFVNPMDR